MPNDNLISVAVEPTGMDAIQQAITTIKTQLPFLLKLSPDKKRIYPLWAINPNRLWTKALGYTETNPHLVPPYLQVVEFKKDMELVKSLTKIQQPLKSLMEVIDDTMIVAGNESYSAALAAELNRLLAIKH